MSKSNTFEVPSEVRELAEKMISDYKSSHPYWQLEDGEWDDWSGTNDYDINLVVDGDGVRAVVYRVGRRSPRDAFGWTDTSAWVVIK